MIELYVSSVEEVVKSRVYELNMWCSIQGIGIRSGLKKGGEVYACVAGRCDEAVDAGVQTQSM